MKSFDMRSDPPRVPPREVTPVESDLRGDGLGSGRHTFTCSPGPDSTFAGVIVVSA